MNVHNVKRVMKAIAEAPAQDFDMRKWHCGTAHCIGGWCEVIAHGEDFNNIVPTLEMAKATRTRAKAFLGITDEQVLKLFFLDYWPMPFRFDYFESPHGEKAVALARLKHFIETDGKE